jgi:hypothetical protein
MQGQLIELEHFRVLLKSSGHGRPQVPFWFTASAQPRFAGGDFPAACSGPSPSRQAHSFLNLAMHLDAANLAHSLSFSGGEQMHRTESAAPLNPFIGTENRII